MHESSRLREGGGGGCWRDQVVVLGRMHGGAEKCFDLISDLKCRDDRYPGRCRPGFGCWGVAVGPVRARGGGGVPQKTFPVTRRDRGGGCSTPSPSAPPPTGAILHRYSARGEADNLSAVNVNTPPRSSSCSPVHGIRSIAMHCPPPRGGGRRRGTRRAAGVFRLFAGKDVSGEMQETGAGDVPPPPRQPLPPRGRFPHRYTASE